MTPHRVSWWLTLFGVIWAGTLVTWVTWRTFNHPPDISAGTAAAFATVFGLPTAVWAAYQWARRNDNKR